MANYVGNDDFRGYLAYLAKNGDGRANLAISGYGTGYVNNEGGINRGLLNELNQAAPGSGVDDATLQQQQVDYRLCCPSKIYRSHWKVFNLCRSATFTLVRRSEAATCAASLQQ